MAFDLAEWKRRLAERTRTWRAPVQDAGAAVYGALCGMTLWPLVEASRSGESGAAMGALFGIGANVGADLIAGHAQRWMDGAAGEADIAAWAASAASNDTALRDALDAVLEKLEAMSQAQQALAHVQDERGVFEAKLREELSELGNLSRFEVVLQRGESLRVNRDLVDSVVIQGHGNVVKTVVVEGEGNVVIVDPGWLLERLNAPHGPAPAEQRAVLERYLAFVVDRYRYLEFKGMGVADRVPLRLALTEMYVPLAARIEMPRAETWGREARVAGRAASPHEREATGASLSRPMDVLLLLRQHDGMIVLGDPRRGFRRRARSASA